MEPKVKGKFVTSSRVIFLKNPFCKKIENDEILKIIKKIGWL